MQAAASLRDVGFCHPDKKCAACTGDCDADADCVKGLKCFQRQGKEKVPGCLGGGTDDQKYFDFCYDPGSNKH